MYLHDFLRFNPLCRQILFTFFIFMTPLTHANEQCHGKRVLGAATTITFPLFAIKDVPAKVDTGAATSSLHCRVITLENANTVSFIPMDSNNTYRMKTSRIDTVKSSNGFSEVRAFIELEIEIDGRSFYTEFSLADRSSMKYPVLLGKKLLKNRFVVDVAR